MPVSFSGAQRLIICDPGTVSLNVQDVYSDWKEWMQSGQGINYLPAFEGIGGQPLPGGLFAGQTYFLINGWKIRPQSANHRLTILGNLYADDGSAVTVPVPGFTIEVSLSTSAQAQGITVSGSTLTLSQIEGSTILAKQAELLSLLSRLSEVRAAKLDRDLVDASAVDAVLSDNFVAVLGAIAALPPSSSIAQLKALVDEIYLLHGLKTDSPLTVTATQRTAGVIVQSIVSSETQTTVARQQ